MPSSPGPGQPRRQFRFVMECRWQRVHLVVIDSYGEWQCSLLGFQVRRDRPAGRQLPFVRFSVALPPGIGAARHAKAGVFSAGRVIKRPVARPRATAMHSTARCGTSAISGIVGCVRLPEISVASWTSITWASIRTATVTVQTVFSCVASRNRESRPAPGYRHAFYGTLWSVGYSGYSWSSTVSGSNVRFLDFGFYGVYPQHSNYRAHGFPLRCLQKEGGGRAADFTLESGGLSVRENLLRLACGAVELWGLNESLSSSPLRPRGLLLSVMRQKVGKERSQGVFAPLANPRFFRTATGESSALRPPPRGAPRLGA